MRHAARFRDPRIWALPALSGALMFLAYYTLHLLVPNLIGLLPLLAWIDRRGEDGRRVWWRGGLVFGAVLNLLILSWMRSMLTISPLAVGAYLGLAFLFSLAQGVVVLVLAWLRHRTGWSFALLLPATWIPMEWIQAQGDLRMTAQQVAHTLSGFPFLIQFADLVGPYGVGAVLLAGNALLYEFARGLFSSRWKSPATVLVLLYGAVIGYGAWRWAHPPQATSIVRVGIVQPDVPLKMKMDGTTDAWQWDRLAELTRKAAADGATLILWPETARPAPVLHAPSRPRTYAMPDVAVLAREMAITLVVGAEYVEDRGGNEYDVYNAAMVVHPDGTLDPVWSAKTFLVPFVEGVPFRPIFGPLLEGKRGALHWLAGGFAPGEKGVVLPAGPARIGATVCFEELYFGLQRRLRNEGANFQAILTNHAWFERTFFQRYAADVVRFRAIENRCWFARVSNTGISGFVDPLGRYHDEIGLFEMGYAVRDVGLMEGPTVYDRTGDLAALATVLLLGCAVVAAARGEGKRGSDAKPGRHDVGAVPGRGPGDHRPGAGAGGDLGGARSDSTRDGQPDPGSAGP